MSEYCLPSHHWRKTKKFYNILDNCKLYWHKHESLIWQIQSQPAAELHMSLFSLLFLSTLYISVVLSHTKLYFLLQTKTQITEAGVFLLLPTHPAHSDQASKRWKLTTFPSKLHSLENIYHKSVCVQLTFFKKKKLRIVLIFFLIKKVKSTLSNQPAILIQMLKIIAFLKYFPVFC